MESVGQKAFYGCEKITSLTLPSSLKNLQQGAFAECTSLSEIEIGDNIENMGSEVFANSRWLNEKPNGFVYLKDYILYCYLGYTEIDTVEINPGVKVLAGGCFNGCQVKKLTLPEGIVAIGDFAFDNQATLESITLPTTLTSIGNFSFRNCSALKEIIIPANVQSIGECTFSACEALASVTLNNKMEAIPSRAFEGCSSLVSIVLPGNIKRLGASAFANCSSLANCEIAEGLTEIESSSFSYCTSLEGIKLPESLVSLGNGAFSNSGLKSIVLPNKLTEMGSGIFADCYNLADVVIGEGITEIPERTFHTCNSLVKISFPTKLVAIGREAFESCSAINQLSLPEKLTKIGMGAFDNCRGLIALSFGESLTEIGWNAFNQCPQLTVVKSSNTLPPTLEAETFDKEAMAQATLYVPNPSIEAYSKAEEWKNFANIRDLSAIPVTNLLLPENELKMIEGTQHSLEITIIPEFATEKVVEWSSSDEAVATVTDSGRIDAISAGEATITAKCGTAVAECKVTIEAAPIVAASEVILSQSSLELEKGSTFQLSATVMPEETTDKTIIWSSADTGIATVSETGLVTALNEGTTKIIASCGEVKAECSLTVKIVNSIVGVEAESEQVELFDLSGNRVNPDSAAPGMYILKEGNKVRKITLK